MGHCLRWSHHTPLCANVNPSGRDSFRIGVRLPAPASRPTGHTKPGHPTGHRGEHGAGQVGRVCEWAPG